MITESPNWTRLPAVARGLEGRFPDAHNLGWQTIESAARQDKQVSVVGPRVISYAPKSRYHNGFMELGKFMDVTEAIKTRMSVRAYEPRQVPDDVLGRILEAGRIAPSASNIQPWHFIVVTDQVKREALSSGRYAKFLKSTPVVIVGLGNRETSPEWHVVDVTIALQTMVLAATGEGLGTCWIGSFHESEVKAALSIPDTWEVVAMLALGYAKETLDLTGRLAGHVHKRKTLDQIISYESFGRTKPG